MEKKKRRELSGERAIALALVEVIELVLKEDELPEAVRQSVDSAWEVLKAHGYSGLESISSRVAKLETALHAAIEKRDGKEIARLGAELNRAQRGLSPIGKVVPAVKKPRKPREKKANGEPTALSGLEAGKSND